MDSAQPSNEGEEDGTLRSQIDEIKSSRIASRKKAQRGKVAERVDKSRENDVPEDVVILDDFSNSSEEDNKPFQATASIGDRVRKRRRPTLASSPAKEDPFIDVDVYNASRTTKEDADEFKGRSNFIGREDASEEDVEMVMEFLAREHDLDAIVWDDGRKNLSGRELRALLFRGPVESGIINAYMRIMQKQSLENGSEIHCVDTNVQENVLYHLEKAYGRKRTVPETEYGDFLSKLSSSTRRGLTELKEDTFRRCKYVVFPINSRWHWFLLVFDAQRGVFKLWSSLHDGRSTGTAEAYVKFLGDYLRLFSGFELASRDVTKERCRQQGSDVSCGVYACLWLHCLAYDTDGIWEYEKKVSVEGYRVRIAAAILGRSSNI